MKKLSVILENVFAYGVLLTLFAGALAGVGFVVAFFIGGETAALLCNFIHKEYFPIIIKLCSIATGCGLVNMYVQKKKALTMESDK